MRAYGSVVFFTLIALTLSTLPAAAQDARPVEITPYVGVGSEAASPVGTAVTFPLTQKLSLETDVAYRRGEGDIHALSSSASLLFSLPQVAGATPYVAGGLGLAQYGAPVYAANGRPIGTQPRVAMKVNAGGGLKMPVNENLDWRTDVRWFKSFGRQGSEEFRVAQGISFDTGKR
jgi:hypothetical protein